MFNLFIVDYGFLFNVRKIIILFILLDFNLLKVFVWFLYENKCDF